ncbi:VOC family protein [Streptomyces sp. NPDC005529]|uniref:VOC family protein n=1 Tax=unclassified Streptomyces TaxID=2593676 RepID=UPI0033AE3944
MTLNLGLDHIALRAYDLNETVDFYNTLGFNTLTEWSAPDSGVNRCVFLDAGDGRVLEIFDAASTPVGGSSIPLDPAAERPADEDRSRNASLIHFAVRTDNPDILHDRAVDAGARSIMVPTEIDTKGPACMTIEIAVVYGLNGEVVEFIKRPNL